MKKIISVLLSIVLAVLMFLNVSTPAEAAGYKAQLILESYELPENLVIGEECVIKVTFKNVDAIYPISNLTLNCSSSASTVIPAAGYSNQIYVGSIRPGTSVEVEIPVVIARVESGYANIQFSSEYMSDETRFTSSAYIVFPVEETVLPSVAIKSVNVPENASLNINSLVSVSFTNTTLGEMYNTYLVVGGDVRGGEVSTKIGVVGINKSAYSEAYVNFVSDGNKKLNLKLVYENQAGETFEEVIGDYEVVVFNSQNSDNTGTTTVQPGTDLNQVNISYIFLAAAGAILLTIIIVFIVNLIRKRR